MIPGLLKNVDADVDDGDYRQLEFDDKEYTVEIEVIPAWNPKDINFLGISQPHGNYDDCMPIFTLKRMFYAIFAALCVIITFIIAVEVNQRVTMHRYQVEPPNVNCDDVVEFYDEYLKDLAFTEWLEVQDLYVWREK